MTTAENASRPPSSPGFTFRRVTDADIAMLHQWISRPHVAAWWDSPVTLDDVADEYGEATCDPKVRPFIAHLGGEPVGFIQVYGVLGAGDGWWPDETDPGARGIDQFLADGTRLDRGLGTAMVRAFVAQIFADPAVTRVQVDPQPLNARAIRCYEKAGFRRLGEIRTPDGAALLMVCERADWPGPADQLCR